MRKAMVGVGALLVLGLPGVSPAETPAEAFEARKKEAVGRLPTEEGKQYYGAFGKVFQAQYVPWATECTESPERVPVNFEFVVKLGAKGSVDDVLVDPESAFATCFAERLRTALYPAPPSAGYWLISTLFLERPPEPGPAEPDVAEPRPSETPARPLQATFIGNMAFHITDGQTAVLTDFPYDPGSLGYYMEWTKTLVPAGPPPLCLVTHSHDDHFAWKRARDFCGRILGPKDVIQRAGQSVSPLAFAHEVRWRGIDLRALATPHGGLEHYSYVVEWGGIRLYFTGDTDDTGSLLEARDLDVAFVSPWLLDAVREKGARIDARQVVVYHHQNDEAVPEVQGRIVPKQGQVLELRSH